MRQALTLVDLAEGAPAQECAQLWQRRCLHIAGVARTQQLRDAAHAVQVIAVGPGADAQAAALAAPPGVLLGSISMITDSEKHICTHSTMLPAECDMWCVHHNKGVFCSAPNGHAVTAACLSNPGLHSDLGASPIKLVPSHQKH